MLPGGIPAVFSASSDIFLGLAFQALHWSWISCGISPLLASPCASWWLLPDPSFWGASPVLRA
eukprot:5009730-Heterocapsa_arctica.AAC.1